MGNQPSTPVPGTPFRVIGAGLPRTGTASFAAALRILLDGPVYHGGTQVTLGSPTEIKSWIKLLTLWPTSNPEHKPDIQNILKDRMDGYAACADAPACELVEELLEIYPDAIVICTTRDPDKWTESMRTVESAATLWFLQFVLFPLPGMRHFPKYIQLLRKQWIANFGERDPVTRKSYDRHIEHLKEIVPEKQLVFFDVKDGWEPLAKALGKEVPDVPFPRINDGEAIERLARRMTVEGLKRWMVVFATVGVGAYLLLG
jgi:hypothetical protein